MTTDGPLPLRLLSWNMAHRGKPWEAIAATDADVALLQEAARPPVGAAAEVLPDPTRQWNTALIGGRPAWRTAIARLTDRVTLRHRPTVTLENATSGDDVIVSREGSVTAADVIVDDEVQCTIVSVYAAWEVAHRRGYADGSAHRILSDLSALLGQPRHRVIVSGDLNLLRGYGEYGDHRWKVRYDTVFDRAHALGLRFAGPEHPHGRRAEPWPDELPAESLCVPTFRHSRQTPATASRQLDFVFVSESLVDHVHVQALNDVDNWGPSDHRQVSIEVRL